MENIIRSKERVSENGEVFTPFEIVDKMNVLIPEDVWKDPTYIYLEPTCGIGNFVIRILEKRIESGISIENACNTLFGMDIMPDNILKCYERVLEVCRVQMLKEGMKEGNKEWIDRSIRIICIVLNNIFRVKDSLEVIKSGEFDKKRFFDYDPTGQGMVLPKSKRDGAISKVRGIVRDYVSGKRIHKNSEAIVSSLFKRK